MEKSSNSANRPGDAPQAPNPRTIGKSVTAIVLGAISTLYILNPTAGVDLIPDFLPIVGNLDEATAVIMLLGCLRYFGLDVTRILGFVKDLPTGMNSSPRQEKVVSPADPEVDAARQAMYAGKR